VPILVIMAFAAAARIWPSASDPRNRGDVGPNSYPTASGYSAVSDKEVHFERNPAGAVLDRGKPWLTMRPKSGR
jgi:hypothetical protein